MKQVELAKQLGISKSYLSMMMSGQRKASPEFMRKLSSLEVHNFETISSLRGRYPKPLDECATFNTVTKCSLELTTALPEEFYHITTSRNKCPQLHLPEKNW